MTSTYFFISHLERQLIGLLTHLNIVETPQEPYEMTLNELIEFIDTELHLILKEIFNIAFVSYDPYITKQYIIDHKEYSYSNTKEGHKKGLKIKIKEIIKREISKIYTNYSITDNENIEYRRNICKSIYYNFDDLFNIKFIKNRVINFYKKTITNEYLKDLRDIISEDLKDLLLNKLNIRTINKEYINDFIENDFFKMIENVYMFDIKPTLQCELDPKYKNKHHDNNRIFFMNKDV